MKSVLLTFALLVSSLSFAQNYKVIHSFSGFPNDGMHAIGPVVFDKAGNMYGTTPGGGSNSCQGDNGCGVVYELSPNRDGSWTESILYNFCANFVGLSCLDGAFPSAGLALDSVGNLYGVTGYGGSGDELANGAGVIFKLSPPAGGVGVWTETVLYNFCSNMSGSVCLDGYGPDSQPVFDASGDLYGTTAVCDESALVTRTSMTVATTSGMTATYCILPAATS
jgi:uncharacterized repeat protein (TIGR03803 family)